MEGNGPGSGDPVPMNVLLMSSRSGCNGQCIQPPGLPENRKWYRRTMHGEKMGLGTWKEEEIDASDDQMGRFPWQRQ